MNLEPGGKAAPQNDTYFYIDCRGPQAAFKPQWQGEGEDRVLVKKLHRLWEQQPALKVAAEAAKKEARAQANLANSLAEEAAINEARIKAKLSPFPLKKRRQGIKKEALDELALKSTPLPSQTWLERGLVPGVHLEEAPYQPRPLLNSVEAFAGEMRSLPLDYVRVSKGLKKVLEERGCYPGPGIRAKCVKTRCPDPLEYTPYDPAAPYCCLARILQNHEDFFEQKSVIEEYILSRGHKCFFLPKFHCEINLIEMVWGWCKQLYRQAIKSSFEHSKQEVVKALDAISVDTMRRFCNRTLRFMDGYRKELPINVVAWCVRKQSSHRAISEGVMAQFDAANKAGKVA